MERGGGDKLIVILNFIGIHPAVHVSVRRVTLAAYTLIEKVTIKNYIKKF